MRRPVCFYGRQDLFRKDISMLKRCSWILLLVLLIMDFKHINCQDYDTAAYRITDQAKNRLFIMSTGQTARQGKFFIGSHEVIFITAGYTPYDFIGFNAALLPAFLFSNKNLNESFWSLGTKLQFLDNDGFVQGMALGIDFINIGSLFKSSMKPGSSRYLNHQDVIHKVLSFNWATSVGTEEITGHINIAKFLSITPSNRSSTNYLQLGMEYFILKRVNGGGTKIICEGFISQDYGRYKVNMIIIGLRLFSQGSAIEFGWPFLRYDNNLKAVSFPYGSLTLFF